MTPNFAVVHVNWEHGPNSRLWLPLFLLWIPAVLLAPFILPGSMRLASALKFPGEYVNSGCSFMPVRGASGKFVPWHLHNSLPQWD